MSVWVLGTFGGAMLLNFSHSAERRVKVKTTFYPVSATLTSKYLFSEQGAEKTRVVQASS